MQLERDRVRSLDGIRAFALVTVLLLHLQQRFVILHGFAACPDGVELFFVLSGFLITTMLLREAGRVGGPNLRHFYLRRATRILPPLLVYLGVVAAVCLGAGPAVPWRALGTAALFLTNVVPGEATVFTAHLWSLAVEEQFYLFWPVLLLASLRWGGRRAAALVCAGLILASPAFRMTAAMTHAPLFDHREGVVLPGRMDSLFAGALLAICAGSVRFERAYSRFAPFAWVAPVFFAVASPVLRVVGGNGYTYTAGYTLESLAAAFSLAWLLRNPHARTSRVLGWRPVAVLGLASYSGYLYQSAILFLWPAALGGRHPALVLLVAAAAGLLAYLLVEVPVERLRGGGRVRVIQTAAAAPPELAVKSA